MSYQEDWAALSKQLGKKRLDDNGWCGRRAAAVVGGCSHGKTIVPPSILGAVAVPPLPSAARMHSTPPRNNY